MWKTMEILMSLPTRRRQTWPQDTIPWNLHFAGHLRSSDATPIATPLAARRRRSILTQSRTILILSWKAFMRHQLLFKFDQ